MPSESSSCELTVNNIVMNWPNDHELTKWPRVCRAVINKLTVWTVQNPQLVAGFVVFKADGTDVVLISCRYQNQYNKNQQQSLQVNKY